MATSYPGGQDEFPPIATDVEMQETVGGRTHRDMHNDLGDAVVAIEAELGTNPAGPYDTVEARLVALSADSILPDPDAKGDLFVATDGNTLDNLAVGADGTVLTADSGETTGVKWAAGSGVFNVLDYGADPTGVADSTAEIQAAIDAAHAVKGGTVLIPIGTYTISGAGLDAKSANIIGAGARSDSTTAVGTVLQGSAQTGPVLSTIGTGGDGTGAYTDLFMGMRKFSGFTIRGDGSSTEQGLHIENTHMLRLRDIVIRNTVGVPLYAEVSYFVAVDDVIIEDPVDAASNDTYWVELKNCNSWRTRNLMLRGLTADAASVGASGAVFIGPTAFYDSESNDFQIVAEYLTVPEGSLGIVDHRGNQNRVELVAYDSTDYGTVTTSWAGVKLSAGKNSYGGNVVTGALLAHDTGIHCYGVWLAQDRNVVRASAGYQEKSIYVASGVGGCHVELVGSLHDTTDAQIIDDSAQTDNYLLERTSATVPQFNWQTYSPVWGGSGGTPSIGDGTLTGRYCRINNTVHFTISLTVGSTTNFNSATGWTFTVPVTASSSIPSYLPFPAYILDSGAAEIPAVARMTDTTSLKVSKIDGTNTVGYNVPMTWAAGDVLTVSGTYEAA